MIRQLKENKKKPSITDSKKTALGNEHLDIHIHKLQHI